MHLFSGERSLLLLPKRNVLEIPKWADPSLVPQIPAESVDGQMLSEQTEVVRNGTETAKLIGKAGGTSFQMSVWWRVHSQT